MRHLSDKALTRLRHGAGLPDLTGTCYRLIEPVARGGMGVVYAAEDQRLQRRVALKVLEVPGPVGELADRLMREARVLARLEHPGIVPVHDVGTLPDGRVFYAMKFVEGQRLDRYIESLASTPDRLRIFLRICDAVAFAHARGVLHRDLKSENLQLMKRDEDELYVKVLDFGLAKLADGTNQGGGQTQAGIAMGTPWYMSPEQANGSADLDARTDIYSLGITALHLLTGRSRSRRRARWT